MLLLFVVEQSLLYNPGQKIIKLMPLRFLCTFAPWFRQNSLLVKKQLMKKEGSMMRLTSTGS